MPGECKEEKIDARFKVERSFDGRHGLPISIDRATNLYISFKLNCSQNALVARTSEIWFNGFWLDVPLGNKTFVENAKKTWGRPKGVVHGVGAR